MFSRAPLVLMVAAFLSFLLLPEFVAADTRKPTISIDIEESPAVDVTTIDSIYTGGAGVVFAFLVVTGMPGHYLSAYDLGFILESPDSSVVSYGFHRTSAWQRLDPITTGFPPGLRLPGQPAPSVLGFWILHLKNPGASAGHLTLTPNPENGELGINLLDGSGSPVTPTDVFSATIAGIQADPADSSDSYEPPDCLVRLNYEGKPIPETRTDGYIRGQVITRLKHGVVPSSKEDLAGTLQDIEDSGLSGLLERLGLSSITRLYNNPRRPGTDVISRTGDRVTLLDTWDVYILEFPAETDLWAVVDSLRITPACIYAEPCFPVKVLRSPSDHHYRETGPQHEWHIDRIQANLAWDLEIGRADIRIGIIDTGTGYMHPDLGGGFGPGYKVVAGYDYTDGDLDPHSECPPPDICEYPTFDHGTAVAGAAAALTNNEIGVAGMAGGGWDGQTGCSIVSFRCQASLEYIDPVAAANAINDSYTLYDCDILNLSYGSRQYREYEREAIFNAHAAGVIVVTSKGYIEPSDPHGMHFPSDYDRDWVISVGASNCPLITPEAPERRVCELDFPGYYFTSEYGYGIDCLAPGVRIWVPGYELWYGEFEYEAFNGTSLSAPITAGVAGLVLSDSVGLCVADVEGLMSASCKDIVTDCEGGEGLAGYDEWSGWGRICADSALMFLRPPWVFQHHAAVGASYIAGSEIVVPFYVFSGPDVYQVYAVRYDIRRLVDFPPGLCSVRVWGRGESTTGWSRSNPNYTAGWCEVVSRSQAGCELRTYVYKICDLSGSPCEDHLYPVDPEDVVFAYTIVGCPGEASVEGPAPDNENVTLLSVSPNPSRHEVRFELALGRAGRLTVSLYDVRGRLVQSIFDDYADIGFHTVEWDGANPTGETASPGVYLYRVESGGATLRGKVVWNP